jgi:peptidoglycan LD-endopeptidase LytH
MAQTTLIPKSYSQREFVDNTKKSQKVLVNAQISIVNISKLLKERTEKREKIYSSIIESKKRRELFSRRQEIEDELESKKIVSMPDISGIINLASRSGKSFIDRIVGSLGYLAAGWILRNLPTWTAMAQEFMARLQEAGRIIGSFVTGTINIFQSSFRLITSAAENLKNFDLFDSSNKVKNSFGELIRSINDMGGELEAGIKLITTPLTQTTEDGTQVGSYSGQEVPALGSTSEDMGAYAESGGSSSAASGNNYERAFLDMIAIAEGTSKSYGTMFGGKVNKDLESGKLTVREAIQLGDSNAKKYGSGATGRYQFMPPTLEGLVRKGVLKMDEKFTPQKQDQAAISLAKGRGVDPSKQLTKNDMYRLGGEWASIEGGPNMKPGGSYGFGGRSQVKYTAEQSLKVYQSKLSSTSQGQQSQQQTSTRLVSLSGTSGTAGGAGRALSTPVSPFLPKSGATITSGKGWRTSTGTYHKGYDVGANEGTPVYSYLPGTVTRIFINGDAGGGYGNAIEWRDSVHGQIHLYAHLQKRPPLSVGQKFEANTLLGNVGGTGYGIPNKYPPHLHWEIGAQGKEVDPGQWLRSVGAEPKDISPLQLPTTSAPPQQAQISQTPTQQKQQQIAQQITPERKAQDIVAIIPDQQTQPSSQMGSQPMMPIIKSGPSMTTVLNNFMKQKLLLELAYV